MSGQLPNLTTSTERKVKINKEIEPHVDTYNIESRDKRWATFPIEVLSYSLLGLLVIGFMIGLTFEENVFSQILVVVIGIISPFYLPYMYFFLRYLKKDEHTEIEVDHKHGYIKYTNHKAEKNLLFHQSQVTNCVIHQSLFLPLNIDYLIIYLEGGEKIYFSSLIIDIQDFVQESTLPYQVKKKFLNLIPIK